MVFFSFNRFIVYHQKRIIQKYVSNMHLTAGYGTAMKILSILSKQLTNANIVLMLNLKKKPTHHKPPHHKAQQTRTGNIQQEMGDAFCCCNI